MNSHLAADTCPWLLERESQKLYVKLYHVPFRYKNHFEYTVYFSDFQRWAPLFCKYSLSAVKVSCCRAQGVTSGPTHQEDTFYVFRAGLVPCIVGRCGNTGKVSSPSLSLQLKVGPTGQCSINTGKVGHLNTCIDMSMIPHVLKDKCALMEWSQCNGWMT